MTLKVQLIDDKTKGSYSACDLLNQPFEEAKGQAGFSLEIVDALRVHGTFNSETRTTAGTTNLVTPNAGGSIWVTDLVINGEKQAGSTVEVRFTDGTENETLFLASQVDAPPNLATSFAGRIQGWKDARIDMITSGAGDASVLIGYIKVPNGLPYAEWDANR